MVAKVVWVDGRYKFVASAAVQPGEIVTRPCGTLAIHDCPAAAKSGDEINPWPIVPGQIVQFDSASATTIAKGGNVYIIPATGLATGTATNNTFVGRATEAKTSGQTSVLVNTAAPVSA